MEFYPTPAWVTRGLLSVEKFRGSVWEPACGSGAISDVVRGRMDFGAPLLCSDITLEHYHADQGFELDFLSDHGWTVDEPTTNPN